MADISIKSETINRLLDVISKGIGAIWEYNTADKKLLKLGIAQAEVKKQEIIKIAEGESEATIIKVNTEKEVRALNRFLYQEIKKQENIENIIEGTIPYLEGESSEGNIDEDWINSFFNYAGNVSNAEIQILWSKILAGEVKRPGTFSIQTLDVLKGISKEDAEKFNKVATFVSNGIEILKLENTNEKIVAKIGLDYESFLNLIEIGLINGDKNLGTIYQGESPIVIEITFINKSVSFTLNKNILQLNTYKLTNVGKNLYKIITPNVDEAYFKELIKYIEGIGGQNIIIK